jgi:hypothetical protein
MLDILVPEIMLQRPRVLAIIGEFEPAGMPQHMRMNWERYLGGLAEPAYHTPEPDGAHGRPALAYE